MSQRIRAMAAGMSAQEANMACMGAEQTGLTGAGTSSQTNALALVGGLNVFSTVAANSGARLPYTTECGPVGVCNNGANALLVYPASGQKMNGGTADVAFSVTNGKSAIFWPGTTSWLCILSA